MSYLQVHGSKLYIGALMFKMLKMKQIISFHAILRLLPLLVLTILLGEEALLGTVQLRGLRICIYFLTAIQMSQYYPLSYEALPMSVYFMTSSAVYYIAAAAVPFCREHPLAFFLIPVLLFTLGYRSLRTSMKYRELAGLFRRDAPWCRLEEDSRSFYGQAVPLLVALLAFMELAEAPSVWYYPLGVSLAVFYGLMHYKSYSGRSLLLSKKKEKRIRDLIYAEMRDKAVSPVDEDLLAGIYRRLQDYMYLHRPYLDDGFSMEDIASYLHVNKLYVSKAVNKYAKKNIRQYINYYRIMYSVELMKDNPKIKVIELAFAAGFHSVVTYNMAFKLVMGITPGDMLARIRLSIPCPKPSMHQGEKAGTKEEFSLPDEAG